MNEEMENDFEDFVADLAEQMDVNTADRDAHANRDHVVENSKLELNDLGYGRYNQGVKDIQACVADPSRNPLTKNGKLVLSLLGRSNDTTTDDIDEEYKLKASLTTATEKLDSLRVRLNEKLLMMSDFGKDIVERRDAYNVAIKSEEPDRRIQLRMAMESLASAEDQFNMIGDELVRIERDVDRQQVIVDGLDSDLTKFRKRLLLTQFTARSVLFSDPSGIMSKGNMDDIPSEQKDLTSMQLIRQATLKDVISTLSTLEGVHVENDDDSFAMFADTGVGVDDTIKSWSGMLNDNMITDYEYFLNNSSVSKSIQAIFDTAYDMESIRKGNVNYELRKTSSKSTNNTLQRELYFLNLIAQSGYNPTRWAQAFGVPISGIGKRILDEWKDSGYVPITADALTQLFVYEDFNQSIGIDYSRLEETVIEKFKPKDKNKVDADTLRNVFKDLERDNNGDSDLRDN
uniref:Uncharacterized protein n=1 Tax=viral metagenome TaxID=1070528 RepID=A0A2V0RJA1_9ZZZZ